MFKLNRDFFAGAFVGFGAGIATRALPDEVQERVRETAKSAIRLGIESFEAAKGQLAQWQETIEDLTAEAKAESVNDKAEEPVVEKITVKAAPKARSSRSHPMNGAMKAKEA